MPVPVRRGLGAGSVGHDRSAHDRKPADHAEHDPRSRAVREAGGHGFHLTHMSVGPGDVPHSYKVSVLS